MRVVGFTTTGGPEVLQLMELPDPEPGAGELLIRVHAAAVNPTDTGPRSGSRPQALLGAPPPYVPGMDAAGVLEGLGEGAETDLRPGDRVMAIVVPTGSHGAYAERIAVPAESVVRAPAGASDAEACTIPMNGLTARLALDLLEAKAGETVAVSGAAGAVGGYAIELARADGLVVIADAAPKDEDLVRALGADAVVPRGEPFARAVRERAPDGVAGLVDAALLNELAVPALRDGGRIATLRGFTGEATRGVSFHPVAVRSVAHDHAKLDRLRQQVEAGQLTPRVAMSLPAEEAAEAHRLLEAGGVRGRIVLLF